MTVHLLISLLFSELPNSPPQDRDQKRKKKLFTESISGQKNLVQFNGQRKELEQFLQLFR